MKTFKAQLSELSDFALEINGLKSDYNENDLINATLVFMEVFSSLMFDNYKNKLNEEQLTKLFEEAGTSFRQTIKLFTNIDMAEYLKNEWFFFINIWVPLNRKYNLFKGNIWKEIGMFGNVIIVDEIINAHLDLWFLSSGENIQQSGNATNAKELIYFNWIWLLIDCGMLHLKGKNEISVG